MKRYVRSASDVPAGFEELQTAAYNAGWNLEVDDSYNITLEPRRDREYMPDVTIYTHGDNGIYTFDYTIEFPMIYGDELNYSDDLSNYIGKWKELADKVIKPLVEMEYDPTAYVD